MIVGLVGKKQSGKSTAADGLEKLGFIRMSLAKPLKTMADTILSYFDSKDDIILDSIYELLEIMEYSEEERSSIVHSMLSFVYDNKLHKAELEHGKPRLLLQKLGTQFFRNKFGDDFWIKMLKKFIEHHGFVDVVVDDIRFPNEAQWLKDNDGILIKIIRPSVIFIDGHESEMAMEDIDGFDHCIINNFDNIQDLQETVRCCILDTLNLKRKYYV